MRVESSHLTEREGVQAVGVLKELGWLYREQPVSDFGIDAHVELVVDGEANGNLIALQVKSGASFFSHPEGEGWAFPFDDKHYQYWVNHDLPIVVVLYDPESGLAYWQAVTHETAVSTGIGWKVVVPRVQRLDGRSAALQALAVAPRPRGDGPAQRFQAALRHLPADVIARLERADEAAAEDTGERRRGVERLAEHLADGRFDPAEACRVLLDRTPGWLPTDYRERWLVVAAYANEHGLHAQAAQAFLRAAEDNPDLKGRLCALAGLAQMQVDLVGSRAVLEAARALPGGQLLADIGLALLDHGGGSGPVPLPPGVLEAASGAAGQDATIQRFLGDRALAADDITAIGHYEQALSLAPSSTSMQITLANTLLRRANTAHSPIGGQDTLQATHLAEGARADRRRWNGASEEAARPLQAARALRLDLAGAVAVARRAPAGEATEREARSSRLAVRAAAIALRGDQIEIAEELEREVNRPGDQAHLNAVRADVEGLDPAERARRWREAIERDEDDDLRLQAAHHLAELGAWPIPELDRLRDEGVLREDVYEVLAARAEAANGETAAAIARLRRVAPHTAMAVQELALVLESAGKVEEAVAACEDAATRLGDPGLRLLALDLLRRSDRPDDARRRAVEMLARPGLPADLRLRIRTWLVHDGSRGRDWPFVEEQATDALEEIATGTDDDTVPASLPHVFQWALIGARVNQRRRQEAWAAVERFDPPIRNEQDARIWLSLVATQVFTAERVRRALALVEQFEDDALLGAAILGTLLVALNTDGGSAPEGEPAGPPPREQQRQGSAVDLTAEDRAELGAASSRPSSAIPPGTRKVRSVPSPPMPPSSTTSSTPNSLQTPNRPSRLSGRSGSPAPRSGWPPPSPGGPTCKPSCNGSAA